MPSTLASYREATELYLRPALGHLRLADLRDHHFRDLAAAMRKINRPEADADRSDLLRRLLAARAVRDGQRYSTRPLTDARIQRVLAVASSSLADLVPHVLAVNPAAAVKLRQGPQGQAAAVDRGPRRAVAGDRARFPAGSWSGAADALRRVPRRHRGRAAVPAVPPRRLLRPAPLRAGRPVLGRRRPRHPPRPRPPGPGRRRARRHQVGGLRAHHHHRPGHGRRPAGVAQGPARRAARVGGRVDGLRPRVHPRGRHAAAARRGSASGSARSYARLGLPPVRFHDLQARRRRRCCSPPASRPR